MRLARRCGIFAAEVEFASVGDREVLLVRRFDRHVDANGHVFRNLYASAHTILRLDTQTRGERQRSYVALAYEIGLCCGSVVGGTSMLFGGGFGVALILLGSISSAMVLAAAIGATVPTVLHALRLDPRIAAGPLSLTLTDVLATSIYLASATLFLMKG